MKQGHFAHQEVFIEIIGIENTRRNPYLKLYKIPILKVG